MLNIKYRKLRNCQRVRRCCAGGSYKAITVANEVSKKVALLLSDNLKASS